MTMSIAAANMHGMSLFPDQPPPSAKPKLSAQERRAREADRLKAIRLRLTIGRELDDRGITDPAAIGAALGLPATEATKLLTRHQWREGDVTLLEAAAAQLGVEVPDQGRPPAGTEK
jgi:hypothetical protein